MRPGPRPCGAILGVRMDRPLPDVPTGRWPRPESGSTGQMSSGHLRDAMLRLDPLRGRLLPPNQATMTLQRTPSTLLIDDLPARRAEPQA